MGWGVRARGAADPGGARALAVEHVGSTSVPGLVAKPIVDVVLVLVDPADEGAYVPALEGCGYVLRVREPEWFEHRMFKGLGGGLNLHVFGPQCAEVARMLAFRDRLRCDVADRERYAEAKRALASRSWDLLQDYADAKSLVVAEILGRA